MCLFVSFIVDLIAVQSEQVAVLKVAGYNLLLQYVNRDLCSRFYPELSLFNLSSEESPAEVVARVAEQKYRYFLTGRADGFIVTLTVTVPGDPNKREALVDAQAQGMLSKICKCFLHNNQLAPGQQRTGVPGTRTTPKFQGLIEELNDMVNTLDSVESDSEERLSYEVVLLEVKRLELNG